MLSVLVVVLNRRCCRRMCGLLNLRNAEDGGRRVDAASMVDRIRVEL